MDVSPFSAATGTEGDKGAGRVANFERHLMLLSARVDRRHIQILIQGAAGVHNSLKVF